MVMTDQWGRFESNASRHLTDLGYENNLRVYTPTTTYTEGEGYDSTYSEATDSPISAEITTPDDDADKDEGGTTAEADLVILVSDDSPITWTEAGSESDAATRVEPDQTDIRYEVRTKEQTPDGLLRLMVVEV